MSDSNTPQVVLPRDIQPVLEANALLADAAALTARLQRDGYLFFRGIIPARPLQQLRDDITAILTDLGWILGGEDRNKARVIGMPQREGEALTEGCLTPHFDRVIWEDIYRDWPSTTYQYYWKNKDYLVVPWDSSLHRLPQEHLKQAIREGKASDRARLPRHQSNPLRALQSD